MLNSTVVVAGIGDRGLTELGNPAALVASGSCWELPPSSAPNVVLHVPSNGNTRHDHDY